MEVGRIGWQAIHRKWMEHLAEREEPSLPLWLILGIQDLTCPDREPYAKWHPRPNILLVQAAMQSWIARMPRGRNEGRPDPNANVQKTLDLLWEVRENAERTAALLIAATAENAMRCGRGSSAVADICKLARERAGMNFYWHHSSAIVIARSSAWEDGPVRRPVDVDDAVAMLAAEHADRLREWVAVRWVFSDTMDEACAREMERRAEVKAKGEEIEAKQAALHRRRTAERRRIVGRHTPLDTSRLRPGMLQNLEPAELTRAVWSRPTQETAALLGVSDVAVAKRCAALGIPKPPKGFWNKVTGGLIPHPNGVPVPDAESMAQGRTRNGRPRGSTRRAAG